MNRFVHWAELKTAFNAIDKVGELTVFNIGANKFRLVADIRFGKQIVLRGKRKLNIRQVRALSERFWGFPRHICVKYDMRTDTLSINELIALAP